MRNFAYIQKTKATELISLREYTTVQTRDKDMAAQRQITEQPHTEGTTALKENCVLDIRLESQYRAEHLIIFLFALQSTLNSWKA